MKDGALTEEEIDQLLAGIGKESRTEVLTKKEIDQLIGAIYGKEPEEEAEEDDDDLNGKPRSRLDFLKRNKVKSN